MREWLRCPLRESLLSEGWAAPPNWDHRPVLWIGNAVHAAMAAFLVGADPDVGHEALTNSMGLQWRQPPVHTAWTLEGATRKARAAYEAILETKYGSIAVYDVVAVERRLKYGTPDLVYRVDDGTEPGPLRVVDWKVRKRAPREMRAWDHDWQLWHYVWEVTQEWVRPAAAEVCVVILEPRVQVVIHEVTVTAERLAAWEAQAAHWWSLREAMNGAPAANWAACSLPYYDCEFKAHCHESASLDAFYVKESDDAV